MGTESTFFRLMTTELGMPILKASSGILYAGHEYAAKINNYEYECCNLKMVYKYFQMYLNSILIV